LEEELLDFRVQLGKAVMEVLLVQLTEERAEEEEQGSSVVVVVTAT
jgi:hypothetical protein